MSYLVLARRWRPQRFADLVGQDVVVRTLKNALNANNLAHAYLLTGIRGVGKTTIARLMAMAANCKLAVEGEPCGQCEACTAIAAGSHLDVQEMDAASHTGVDDMRDTLDDVRYPPVNLPYKVYIIDEAHMLSKSAFNALLKTLEEPPARVLFILATTESEKLPVTVRSRCQRFDLRRLGVQEVADYLAHVLNQEKVSFESEALLTIARSADGSVRDALSLTERVLAFSNQHIMASDVRQSLGLVGPDVVQGLSDCIAAGDAAEGVTLLRQAVMQGYGARQLLLALSEQWHQLACMMIDPHLVADVPSEQTQGWLKRAVSGWRSEALDMRYQILIHGLRDLTWMDEQRGAEMIVMRLCHLKSLLEPHAEVNGEGGIEQAKGVVPESTGTPMRAIHQEAVAVETPSNRAIAKDTPQAATHANRRAELYDSWKAVLSGYAKVNMPAAMMLEQLGCRHYSDEKIELMLKPHQARMMTPSARADFVTWLGREVMWHRVQEGESVPESVTEGRERRAKEEQEKLWQQAEADPHVQMLVRDMDCRLIDVQPAPSKNENSDVES